jgi:hypothetical protein
MKTDRVSNHMKTMALEVGSAYTTWVFSDSFLFAVLEMCILNNHWKFGTIILASFLLCFQVSSFLSTRNSKRYLLWWTLYGQMWCKLRFSFFNWDLPLVSIYFSQMILYGMHGLSDWWYIFCEYLSLCAMMPKCCTSWGLWSYMPGLPGYQCLQTVVGAKSRNLGDGLIVVYWSVCRCQLLNNPWFVSFNFVM